MADLTIPGFTGKSTDGLMSASNYRMRYLRVDLGDPGDLGTLEDIMTKGLDGQDIVILGTKDYTFQDRFFMVVTYAEKRSTSSATEEMPN